LRPEGTPGRVADSVDREVARISGSYLGGSALRQIPGPRCARRPGVGIPIKHNRERETRLIEDRRRSINRRGSRGAWVRRPPADRKNLPSDIHRIRQSQIVVDRHAERKYARQDEQQDRQAQSELHNRLPARVTGAEETIHNAHILGIPISIARPHTFLPEYQLDARLAANPTQPQSFDPASHSPSSASRVENPRKSPRRKKTGNSAAEVFQNASGGRIGTELQKLVRRASMVRAGNSDPRPLLRRNGPIGSGVNPLSSGAAAPARRE